MSEASSRVSVSEDKLRLLFAEFKLELVKELNSYARAADVKEWKDAIEKRLRFLEDTQTGNAAVSRRQQIALGLAVTFASAVVGALVYLVATGVH